jgi:hypothetical protein
MREVFVKEFAGLYARDLKLLRHRDYFGMGPVHFHRFPHISQALLACFLR